MNDFSIVKLRDAHYNEQRVQYTPNGECGRRWSDGCWVGFTCWFDFLSQYPICNQNYAERDDIERAANKINRLHLQYRTHFKVHWSDAAG